MTETAFAPPTGEPVLADKMDDYSLERVPAHARRDARDVFVMLFGASTMMLPLLYGGIYAMGLKFWTAQAVMVVAVAINWLVCYLVAVPAQQEGLTVDLLSRNMLGRRGSAITSAIYGFADILFFSFEALFLSAAITGVLHIAGVGLTLLNLCIALAFVPLVLFGFNLLVTVARIALPLYVVSMVGALIYLFAFSGEHIDLFGYTPKAPIPDVWKWAIPFVMGSIVINAIQGADYARFLKTKRSTHAVPAGWTPVLFGMPTLGIIFYLATDQIQPGAQFAQLYGLFGVILAILSQVKINTNNAYTASLALSNLGAQALNWRPGRQVWVVFACIVGWILIETKTVDHAQTLLDINALLMMAWISIIVGDYWVARKWLRLAPARMGLKGIPAINPIGVPAILAGLGAGWFAPIWDQKWLTAAIVALGLYTVGSLATRGRFLHTESAEEAAEEAIADHYIAAAVAVS